MKLILMTSTRKLRRVFFFSFRHPMCSGRLEMELPYFTKFLLIAAYLASHNPAKLDVKLFSSMPSKSRAGQTPSKRVYILG